MIPEIWQGTPVADLFIVLGFFVFVVIFVIFMRYFF